MHRHFDPSRNGSRAPSVTEVQRMGLGFRQGGAVATEGKGATAGGGHGRGVEMGFGGIRGGSGSNGFLYPEDAGSSITCPIAGCVASS